MRRRGETVLTSVDLFACCRSMDYGWSWAQLPSREALTCFVSMNISNLYKTLRWVNFAWLDIWYSVSGSPLLLSLSMYNMDVFTTLYSSFLHAVLTPVLIYIYIRDISFHTSLTLLPELCLNWFVSCIIKYNAFCFHSELIHSNLKVFGYRLTY